MNSNSKLTEEGANRIVQGLTPPKYDKVVRTSPDAVTDVYTFTLKNGANMDVLMGVVTLIYSDASKATMNSAERTA